MVIVDTTVWIDYFRGATSPETRWLERFLPYQRLGITDLSVCEILQGIREDRDFNQVRDELLRLQVFETGGADLAIATAEDYRTLRARGHTVRKTFDCLIATFCLRSGHSLLHRDRDFDPFERLLGLKVVRA